MKHFSSLTARVLTPVARPNLLIGTRQGRRPTAALRLLIWLGLLLAGVAPAWATNPVLLIQGINPSGGDNTAFIDDVQIIRVSDGALMSGAVLNPGFESPVLPANSFQHNPPGGLWTFLGSNAGIGTNANPFGSPTAPQGAQVGIIQTGGAMQQTLTLGTGTYQVQFRVSQRNCCADTNNQLLNVQINGVSMGTNQTTNTTSYDTFVSAPFTVDPPGVSSFTPARNALAVALATNVVVNFSQNMDNATASNLKVFSAQAGGRKAGTYSTSGGTVTFDPTAGFEPGETVFTTIPTAVASTGGATNTTPLVTQFTTATGGTGRGNFLPGSDLSNAGGGFEVVAADFNGDGILDLADTGGGLEVRFGTGTGTYGAVTTYASAGGGFSLTAGDLDGDGDIDLVVPRSGGTIAVMQNNGSGGFAVLTAAASSGSDPRKAALGDIDADGDLDMLVPVSGGGAVGVYFNNGSGGFTGPTTYGGSANSTYVVLGDVDRDGDLDYAVADYNNARVVVRLNNGSGTFSGGSNVTVGSSPSSLALADVNGDGALDILTANEGVASVSVSLNGNTGSGSFNASSAFAVPATCSGLAMGDVDADGDLDLVAGSRGATGFYLLLNNGAGSFGSASNIAATTGMFYLTLADLDNDGDLDLAGAFINGAAVAVRLNQQLAPTITSFSPNPAGFGVPVTLTGTTLTGATALSINGAAATILTNTATSITFRVPAGATATGTSSVTTPGGTASSTAFTVLPAPGNALALDGVDDYVTGTSALLPQGNAARTLEAWVLTTTTGGVIFNYGAATSNQRSGILVGSNHLYYVGENNDLQGNITITDGKWHHVAATYNGTTLSLYVDGALDVSSTMPAFNTTGTSWNLGKRIPPLTSTELFNGRIDEMRVYNAALTLAQVQADMRSTSSALPANLVAYYSFDEGTASGNNTGLTTLYDQSSNLYTGTLTNYTSPGLTSGNTTSNWVESYALVLPTVAAATAVAGTSFTANWTAPTIGTAVTYYVDVATNATFTTGLTTSSVAAPATSLSIAGRTNNTTYYYRVRAEKTAAIGQGGTYAYATVTTLPLPTITSISPNPGVRGQAVTLTGTNLSGVTSVSVNGVAATVASFINNTATSLTFRVPATAGASGTTSVTNAGGTASIGTFTTVAATPPGNALAFDGTDDYVTLPTSFNTANFTFEAWVNYQNNGVWTRIFDFGANTTNWMLLTPRSGYAGAAANNIAFGITNTGGGGAESTILSTTPMPIGSWHHVAVTLATAGSITSGTLYLDGVVIGTNPSLPISPASLGALTNNWLGRSQYADPYFKGRLDEVRIYNAALTLAQVQADMLSTSSALPGSQVAYFNFDQGTAGGNNVGQTTLYDQTASAYAGTLTNYTSPGLTSGNTTSNWVESYALVVPVATAATAVVGTSFTANWTAPAIGTVDNGYRLDVSTVSTFASVIAGSPFTVASGLSQPVAGLANNTTYYYRVRADKTSVTGQGDNSNVISVTTLPLPTITSISPNPGVRGQAVTLTGTNLSGVTSVSVNGVAATGASFINNTATSLTFRVPATAGASGTTSVTNAGGTASTGTFTTVAANPPGNALAFDGTDDYVTFGSTPAANNLGPGSLTLEAWVYYDGGSGAESIIRKDGDYNFYINGNTLHAEVWPNGVGNSAWKRFDGSTILPANRWAHVAAVWSGGTMLLYVNGVSQSVATTTSTIAASANLTLGKSLIYGNLLNGRLDEVRIYNAALTLAQVQADMLSTSSALPANQVAYFNFDQGTAGGNNVGQTTLYDQTANAYAGTLTNYTSPGLTSGNTTSNWVESYALVLPTATAATAVAGTSFTANWTAPAIGTVDNGYRVDVSTVSTFASVITGSPFTVSSGTSLAVTGLAASTTYYYRVRADKTSVTGQGDNSNVITVTTLPVITSFSPTSGAAGTSVTLTGSGLSGATSVSVNGVAVTPTVISATSLTFVVPAGASATQSITVTGPSGTSAASTAFTVLLNVASTNPVANARTAPTTSSATAVTFTEPITAASAANLKVFSTQLGGRKAGTVTVAGSTASFAATASTTATNFKPGETLSVTVPASITNANGLAASKRVYQFTTAVGGLGRGNFTGTQNPAVGNSPVSVAVGDVNGDGALDLLTANIGVATVSVRLNNGTGTFAGGSDPAVGSAPMAVTLGDVDGDGDLDFVSANDAAGTASVRLNNGTGTFGGSQDVAVGANPYCVALGDIDGDGDLDLLTGNAGGITISTRFNDGTGTFSGGTDLSTSPYRLAGLTLGDLDGDGDLDIAGASYGGMVLIRLNNGAGVFSGSTNLAVSSAENVALGDIDGDSDLDLVAVVGNTAGQALVWLNNGNATFTAGQSLTAGDQAYGVALGDVDADGDLDLAVASRNTSSLTMFLNNGTGTYTSAPAVPIAAGSSGVAFGDVDADGDLDLLATGFSTVSVRLNQAPAPAITSVVPNPGGLGQSITITGTNLTGATALTINGANALAGIISNSGTSLVVRVPTTATASGTVSVTTPGGTATSATFTIMAPPGNALAFDGTNDYVSLASSTAYSNISAAITLEAWVRTSSAGEQYITTKTDDSWYLAVNGGGSGAGKVTFYLNGVSASSGGWLAGATTISDGHWHHVAGTYDGTTLKIYVDGVLDASRTVMATIQNGGINPVYVGSRAASLYWNGSIDEFRVYNTALTQANIQADMRNTTSAVPASQVLYLNFDQGTPATASTGANTAYTTLYDLVSAAPATLSNFALTSGNVTSNYVESYAFVVPTATAATALAANGFTANWTAPATGTVDNGYRLDVATNATFTAGLTTYTVASGLSQAVTGLTAGTTYYYRVRADKTSVTGQGDNSNTITAATCAPPVAIAQNVTVVLNSSGNASTTATAVNNGSTANCGVAAAGTLSLSPSSFTCTDVTPATVASSLAFNGTNQYIAIPTTATVPVGNSSYTIEAWIKPTAMGVYGVIGWGNYGTNSQVNAIRLSSTGIYNYWWNNDLFAPTANLAGAWHHVAATFNGTTRTLYLDGVAIGSDTPAGHAVPTAANLRIGSTNNGEYFPGSIDEVRVWSVARTAAQINAAKGAGLPGTTAGLVAYYRLNEGSGLTTADATGNAANLGTLTNGPTWTIDTAPVTNGVPVTLTVTDAGGNTSTTTAVVTVQDNLAPTAVTQAVSLPLTINSTATLTASAINNGSSDNCGPLTLGIQKVVSGVVSEGGNLTLTAPAGMVFTAITFASYGTPIDNGNGTYSIGGCHASNSLSQATSYFIGQNSATLPANNGIFGNPCGGTSKALVVQAIYGSPLAQVTYTCAEVGTRLALLSVTDPSGNTSTQVATVNVTVPTTPTTTWSGASSTDWADCANWSYGKVPDAATNAVIPTGQPRYPSLTTGNTYAALALTVNTGGSLTLASGATLEVNGNFANNGATPLSGTVAFVGSAATQTLGGSTSTPFTTLVVNKGSGTVQLGQVLTINAALTLTSGTLTTTGSYQVNLGTSASISETETSYVIGKVVVNRTLTAGTAEPFSGLGLTLTPAAGSTAPGATLVTRVTGTALTGVGTSQSVQRYFNIQPTVNTGLNVTMDFGYFTHELNGIPTANLTLFKSVTTTAGPWAYLRPTTLAANVVTRTGIADFSIWTLGNSANPLPVELTAFTATAEGNAAVRLNWTTASEKNSARFEVERSLSGTSFDRIGTVAGQGSKASATDYTLLDGKLPASATMLYYRLRLVDLDGNFSYSPVRVVTLTASATPQLLAYPNPAHATVRVLLLGPATTAPLQVYDALGRLVHSQAAPAIGAEAVLPVASLPTGVYVLRCGALTQRLTLE